MYLYILGKHKTKNEANYEHESLESLLGNKMHLYILGKHKTKNDAKNTKREKHRCLVQQFNNS